jgi:hypothetical protein
MEDITTVNPGVSFQVPSSLSLANHRTFRRYMILDTDCVVDKQQVNKYIEAAETGDHPKRKRESSSDCV